MEDSMLHVHSQIDHLVYGQIDDRLRTKIVDDLSQSIDYNRVYTEGFIPIYLQCFDQTFWHIEAQILSSLKIGTVRYSLT